MTKSLFSLPVAHTNETAGGTSRRSLRRLELKKMRDIWCNKKQHVVQNKSYRAAL
jgi:hypothetical protein